MSKKSQRETNVLKFPTIGIFLGLLYLPYFYCLSFQLTNQVPKSRGFPIPPTKISASDAQKIPGKAATYFIEEIEEKKEEKSPKHSLGNASTAFGINGLKTARISKTIFSPTFVFYHKVSLYILFQSLQLDLLE